MVITISFVSTQILRYCWAAVGTCLGLCFVAGILMGSDEKAKMTIREVRELVESALADDSSVLDIYAEKENDVIYYNLHRIEKLLPKHRMGNAIRTQIVVEYLKRRPKNEKEGWLAHIAKLEMIVGDDIEMANMKVAKDKLDRLAKARSMAFDEVFQHYATLRGAKTAVRVAVVFEVEDNGKDPAHPLVLKRFDVRLSVVPPAKADYYVSAFQYVALKKLGIDSDITHWYQVNGDKAKLSGAYHFYIHWAEKKHVTGKIKIDEARAIELTGP